MEDLEITTVEVDGATVIFGMLVFVPKAAEEEPGKGKDLGGVVQPADQLLQFFFRARLLCDDTMYIVGPGLMFVWWESDQEPTKIQVPSQDGFGLTGGAFG